MLFTVTSKLAYNHSFYSDLSSLKVRIKMSAKSMTFLFKLFLYAILMTIFIILLISEIQSLLSDKSDHSFKQDGREPLKLPSLTICPAPSVKSKLVSESEILENLFFKPSSVYNMSVVFNSKK